jgi:membrane-associated phospholipid phosphatase
MRYSYHADRESTLATVALAATVTAGLVALGSIRRSTAHLDRKVGKQLAARPHSRVRKIALASGPLGKWYVFLPFGLGVSAYLVRTRPSHRNAAASAVAMASVLSVLLEKAFDKLPQPPVPPGRSKKSTSVLPSGHAFVPASVLLTSAYILTREELLPAYAAYPLAAAIPVASAGAKLLSEKHWPSDVIVGGLAGIGLAAGCALAYEVAVRRSSDPYSAD